MPIVIINIKPFRESAISAGNTLCDNIEQPCLCSLPMIIGIIHASFMFQGTDLVSAPLVVSTDREEVIDFASSYFVEYTAVVNISSFSVFLYFSITDTKEGSQSVAIYISHRPLHFDFGNSKTLYHHNISTRSRTESVKSFTRCVSLLPKVCEQTDQMCFPHRFQSVFKLCVSKCFQISIQESMVFKLCVSKCFQLSQ